MGLNAAAHGPGTGRRRRAHAAAAAARGSARLDALSAPAGGPLCVHCRRAAGAGGGPRSPAALAPSLADHEQSP
jgi:hypothetical protein